MMPSIRSHRFPARAAAHREEQGFMDLYERCLHLCKHITTLTGVHSTLLNVAAHNFSLPPFRLDCALAPSSCTAYKTHLYGAYEAERWDGKYIYYCPRGLTFIATPALPSGEAMEYCIITGPIIMGDSNDPVEDTSLVPDPLEGVPRLTTAQTRSLSEILAAAVASFSSELLPPDVDSGQSGIMQMMYDLSSSEYGPTIYPIETERKLQDHIRAGDKDAAQKLLNELLVYLYAVAGNDLRVIKVRLHELLVLMSRAAIDGGADVDEILSLCSRYEQSVDNFRTPEVLNRWISQTLHKFMSFVFDFDDIKHQNIVFKTTAYLKEHLAEKVTLEQAADQVFLSKSYFCRIIKSEVGCTFTEYVNRLRIERGKSLLVTSNLGIADIAGIIGFDDQSYFSRIFKKQVGMAPGKYRDTYSHQSKKKDNLNAADPSRNSAS